MSDTRISKGEAVRVAERAFARFNAGEVDGRGEPLTPEALVEDETTRRAVPNRADRRARRFGRGMNVKAAARHEQYLLRQRRQVRRLGGATEIGSA